MAQEKSKKPIQKTNSKKPKSPRSIGKTAKPKRQLKALRRAKITYYKARDYVDIKLPNLMIRKGIVLILLIILGILIILPDQPHSLELQSSRTCVTENIPASNLNVFNRFNIQNTTTYEEFDVRFSQVKKDLPGLTKYYGPNLNKNTPKTGVGVHLSKYGFASFILIWEKPIFEGYTLNDITSNTAEQDGLVTYIPGNKTSKLKYIWIYDESGKKVCEQNF